MFHATTTSPSPARRAQVQNTVRTNNFLTECTNLERWKYQSGRAFCYCKNPNFHIIVTSVSQWPVTSPLWWRTHALLVGSVRGTRSTLSWGTSVRQALFRGTSQLSVVVGMGDGISLKSLAWIVSTASIQQIDVLCCFHCIALWQTLSLLLRLIYDYFWQHQVIRGPLSENIITVVSTASTTSRGGQMRPSAFTISATGERETGLNISRRDSDCHVTWRSFPKTRTHGWCLCGKRKRILKGKAQEKTHQRNQEDNL